MDTKITIEYIDAHGNANTGVTDLWIEEILERVERARPVPIHVRPDMTGYINPSRIVTINVEDTGEQPPHTFRFVQP